MQKIVILSKEYVYGWKALLKGAKLYFDNLSC